MVLGGFNLQHRTPLPVVNGRLTGVVYRDSILRPLVMPALQAVGNGAVFQDNNASCHRAAVVNTFLQQQGVFQIDWPARSPDMNPTKHLWDVLGRRVPAHNPPAATLQDLGQLLQQEWQAIPQATLQHLIQSMRLRCNACLYANGGHSRCWTFVSENGFFRDFLFWGCVSSSAFTRKITLFLLAKPCKM